jgi:hypothetical protein
LPPSGSVIEIATERSTTVKYALLIYGDETEWATASDDERKKTYEKWGEFDQLLRKRNAATAGEELDLTSTATTVRDVDDEFILTDGPFAETAEQLAGFIIVEAADLDEAIEYAKACPAGVVEVRPVAPPPAGL